MGGYILPPLVEIGLKYLKIIQNYYNWSPLWLHTATEKNLSILKTVELLKNVAFLDCRLTGQTLAKGKT